MSKMYIKAKEYYDKGLWSKEQVYNIMLKGKITEEEYKEIVGEVE